MEADDDYSADDDSKGSSKIYSTIFVCLFIAVGLAVFAYLK